MSVFVNKEEEIKVDIYSGKNKDGIGIASSNKDDVDVLEDEFSILFRKPSYKDNTELLSNASKIVDGSFSIDLPTLRYLRVIQLVKSWNLKDRVSVELIDGLKTEVGEAIQLALENKLK
jgi:hypothetical protein